MKKNGKDDNSTMVVYYNSYRDVKRRVLKWRKRRCRRTVLVCSGKVSALLTPGRKWRISQRYKLFKRLYSDM